MANHCIDVICGECGWSWCERGCAPYTKPQPQPEVLERWQKEEAEIMLAKPGYKPIPLDDAKCSSCGSTKVYMK